MKQITNAYLSRGRNAEHFTFHDNVLAAFTADIAAELKIESLHERYSDLFRKEDEIYMYNSTEDLTKEVKEKDKVRDSYFSYLKAEVSANLICPVAERKAAAEKLNQAIKPYRDANYRPLRENTGLIRNLVSDLQSEAMAPYLATLALADIVEQLRKSNEDFNAVAKERASTRLLRDSSEKMKNVRPLVDGAYMAVVNTVNILYAANEMMHHDEKMAKTLGGLIDMINCEVNEFQRALAQRGAGRKADITGDGTQSKPGTGGGTPDDGTGTGGTGSGGTESPGTGGSGSEGTGGDQGGDDSGGGGSDFD